MGKFNSHIFGKVDHGKLDLFFRGSDDPQRVRVDADGTITNRLPHGQNTVEHFFVLVGDARFVAFELKNGLGKPGLEDFQIPGQTMVGGKATFSSPLQSFVLRNLNTKKSEFEYGFTVVADGRRIEFDPAVRNLGDYRPPYHPESWVIALLVGIAIGIVATLVLTFLMRA